MAVEDKHPERSFSPLSRAITPTSRCQAGYIGSTIRAFIHVDEHKGQSSRTGRRSYNPPHSAVRDHSETTDDAILICRNV
ncbi:hypothetical protein E2C01_046296 [Portunus trituberculatus]|uniref:Uncharacterized protein n=1 Tax=Portunus trituberculatus TaxID=210409 RepID=A0A5B7G4H5_PORTR|nr:hypothetical protein [Portunus trituberculatus]